MLPLVGPLKEMSENNAKAMAKDYRFMSPLSVRSYNSIPDGIRRP